MDSQCGRGRANAIYALGDLATIQMTPRWGTALHVFDAHYEDHLAGFAQEHCRKLITPDLEQIDKVPEHYRDHGAQDAIDADVLKKRDTPRSWSATQFARRAEDEAVERWNEACERGETITAICRPSGWYRHHDPLLFYGCRIGGNPVF